MGCEDPEEMVHSPMKGLGRKNKGNTPHPHEVARWGRENEGIACEGIGPRNGGWVKQGGSCGRGTT